MTVTLPGPLLLACAVLGLPAVLVLGEARHVLRARRRDRKTPVPGNATPPQVAAPRSQPRQTPAPGFTSAELIKLTQIDQWAEQVAGEDPHRLANAGTLADAFRGGFGHLDDDELGRLLLAFSVVARDYGLAGMSGRLPGTLALAAAELTRLTRTDVHLDHH